MPQQGQVIAHLDAALRDRPYRTILRLAGPLILSMTGFMLMQLTDGLFLAWHSAQAIAAVGPSGMANLLVQTVFLGATGYTATLAAQYVGADRPRRVGPAVWQGVYLALPAAAFVAALAPLAGPLFRWVGHAAEVRELEESYFRILCLGSLPVLLSNALSGFFAGRSDTRTLMFVQLCGFFANAVLDYAWIFGRLGFPAMGVAGAALATVAAQALVAVLLAVLFLQRRHRAAFNTWEGRRLAPDLLGRLMRFGVPDGLRFAIEILAWMMFLFYVGRLGTADLAATTIAWRINGLAFFPIIGLAQAIRILAGQAQGSGRPDLATRATFRGLWLAELWMLAAAAIFLVAPRELYSLFREPGTSAADPAFLAMADMGVVLLRFVAVYCLLDGWNVVFLGALQAVGDTRWTLTAALLLHAGFLAELALADWLRLGLYAEWVIVTVFVMAQALIWFARFRSERWKHIRVIEPLLPEESALPGI